MKKLFILALVLSVVSTASAAELAKYALDDNAADTTVAALTGNEGTASVNTSVLSTADSTPIFAPSNSMAFGNSAGAGWVPNTVAIGNPGLPTIPSLTVSTWDQTNRWWRRWTSGRSWSQ